MSRRSRLYESESAAGAVFGEWFGWELPARYGDPSLEYHAVRNRVGLIDLSYRGILELAGRDRARFLNGMVTNDIKSLKAGSGQYAAMLTVHGKLMADMRIYNLADAYWLELHEDLAPKTHEALTRHLIADQVEIRDRSGEFIVIALQGPAGIDLFEKLGIGEAKGLEEYQHLEVSVGGTTIRLIRASETGEEGFIAVVPVAAAETVWQTLMEAGRTDRLRRVGMEAVNVLRIEAGVPWYGLDMDETTLLQEAGLERAASFSKGCYIGQETVTRIAHRGHVNRHLVGLLIEGGETPEAGATLFHEHREVGRITSAVHSPALGRPVALGYVHRESLAPGAILELQTGKATSSAEIVPLPFYKRR